MELPLFVSPASRELLFQQAQTLLFGQPLIIRKTVLDAGAMGQKLLQSNIVMVPMEMSLQLGNRLGQRHLPAKLSFLYQRGEHRAGHRLGAGPQTHAVGGCQRSSAAGFSYAGSAASDHTTGRNDRRYYSRCFVLIDDLGQDLPDGFG